MFVCVRVVCLPWCKLKLVFKFLPYLISQNFISDRLQQWVKDFCLSQTGIWTLTSSLNRHRSDTWCWIVSDIDSMLWFCLLCCYSVYPLALKWSIQNLEVHVHVYEHAYHKYVSVYKKLLLVPFKFLVGYESTHIRWLPYIGTNFILPKTCQIYARKYSNLPIFFSCSLLNSLWNIFVFSMPSW